MTDPRITMENTGGLKGKLNPMYKGKNVENCSYYYRYAKIKSNKIIWVIICSMSLKIIPS